MLLILWEFIGSSIDKNLNPLHSRMHSAKFGWNLPSGSGFFLKIKKIF